VRTGESLSKSLVPGANSCSEVQPLACARWIRYVVPERITVENASLALVVTLTVRVTPLAGSCGPGGRGGGCGVKTSSRKLPGTELTRWPTRMR
jgi:hypothetical protein